MNIMTEAAHIVAFSCDVRDACDRGYMKGMLTRLRREIHPTALNVPLSCLDGGMRQVVEAYKAGMAALEGKAS